MMDVKLHDYTENNPPNVSVSKPILHPTNRTKVIGHIGRDYDKEIGYATFPRKHDEHWFRGQSTSGLTGYGISESVLEQLDKAGRNTIARILVIETDKNRVIEYERQQFTSGTIVAYAPELDECVIGDETMRVDENVYNDRQRVVPVTEARQVYGRNDVTIRQ